MGIKFLTALTSFLPLWSHYDIDYNDSVKIAEVVET